jgi:hypothetical protein
MCDVAPRHATLASPPYHRVRMPEQACDRWSKAGLREHYVPTGHDTSPALRSVPRGRSTLARARTRHLPPLAEAPPHVANRLCAHADAPVDTKPGQNRLYALLDL